MCVNHKGTVVLETERLILRRFVPEDMEQVFYNCWIDHDVWKWTCYAPLNSLADVNRADMFTEGWLGSYRSPKRYNWAIQLKETGEVIGRYFGMHPDDELREIELACEIGKAWWNQGLMTEATMCVIRFFFEEVGMNRIFAWNASENPASGRMQEKAGMKREGTLRQAGKCNNGIFDKEIHAILAGDYFSEKETD